LTWINMANAKAPSNDSAFTVHLSRATTMSLRPPIDVAAHVSAELSVIIEALVDDPDREQPPTLADVQVALKNSSGWSPPGDVLHPQDRTSVVIELDELIRRHGENEMMETLIRFTYRSGRTAPSAHNWQEIGVYAAASSSRANF
jgi:uncharacterized protein (DUF2267 family)